MKRALISQILREWKVNVWLVFELIVVLAAIWFILLLIYGSTSGLLEPRGFDPENVYVLDIKTIQKSSPEYIEGLEKESRINDLTELMKRMRENPYVEEVAIGYGALPYNYNYAGNGLFNAEEPDSSGYYGNTRWATPGIIKIMNYKSLTGKSADQLTQMLKNGEVLISNNQEYEHDGRKVKNLLGAKMYLNKDSSTLYKVGDIIEKVRRSDYESSFAGTIIVPLVEGELSYGEFIVKIKKGKEQAFESSFREDKALSKVRNVYLSNLTKLTDMRDNLQREIEISVRMEVVIMIFLLVTVFLGLLGSFWFRVQQRVGEIAIRQVCGASRKDIFRRVISEGLIILSTAVILLSALIFSFIKKILEFLDGLDAGTFLLLEVFAILILVICVVVSLWFPAKRAMQIEPAIAVKEE